MVRRIALIMVRWSSAPKPYGLFYYSEELKVSESEIGTVKFVSDRGFLFLVPDRGGKDVFAHIEDFKRAGLREPVAGEKYEYELEMTPKGLKAVNLVAVL